MITVKQKRMIGLDLTTHYTIVETFERAYEFVGSRFYKYIAISKHGQMIGLDSLDDLGEGRRKVTIYIATL